jgi:hypothetical protein
MEGAIKSLQSVFVELSQITDQNLLSGQNQPGLRLARDRIKLFESHCSDPNTNTSVTERRNKLTEPLPCNDRRDAHTQTETDSRDLRSTPLRWLQVP